MSWINAAIDDAIAAGGEELDLSGSAAFIKASPGALTEIPARVFEMTGLRRLNLSRQALHKLPPEIGRLELLEELNVSGNRDLDYCSGISGLGRLKKLSAFLCDNGKQDFGHLPDSLEVLDISYSGGQIKLPVRRLRRLRELQMKGIGTIDADVLYGLAEASNLDTLGIIVKAKSTELIAEALRAQHALTNLSLDIESTDSQILEMLPELQSLDTLNIWWSSLENEPSPTWLQLRQLKRFSLIENNYELRKERKSDMRRVPLNRDLVELALNGWLPGENWEHLSPQLEHVRIHDAHRDDISAALWSMPLRTLTLIDCNIAHLPDDISRLQQLERLNLSGNPIEQLPESLGEIRSLKNLWLVRTGLSRMPATLSRLDALEELSLHGSQLARWPDPILDLERLKTLVLSNCGLSQLPAGIGRLTHLRILSIENNDLRTLPQELSRIRGLRELNVDANPLEFPPPEIIARGTDAIVGFLKEWEPGDSVPLREAKVIVVGEGEVGKTCLSRKLMDPTFDPRDEPKAPESTRGIVTEAWKVRSGSGEDFRVNLWDFGGQEIYHATHQFFLTRRSVYLLVWDARKEDRLGSFDYWLNIISLLSDKSPILVVLNKADERIKEIDQRTLSQRFPNIEDYFKVSTYTGRNMDALRGEICRQVEQLPHVRDRWPRRWNEVRERLEKQAAVRDFIDAEEYYSICESVSLNREQAKLLSGYLHDLGVVLHFQEDPVLQKIVILKPEWGTNAVYAVLDTQTVQERNGRFSMKDLETIWGGRGYPSSKYAELLSLMIKFELCFQLAGTQDYIAPELLSPAAPTFDWSETGTLRFELHYAFMPAGMLTRFIARQHAAIDGGIYWREGVLLAWDGTRALVSADQYARRIRVSLKGDDPKSLLAVIRHEFSYIHRTLNDPLVDEMVPCCCTKCLIGEPQLYKFRQLRHYAAAGARTILCPDSVANVPIQQLLEGIYNKPEIEEALRASESASSSDVVINVTVEKGGLMNVPINPTPTPPSPPSRPNAWVNGSFYLLAAILLLAILAVIARMLSVWAVVVIGPLGLIIVTVIGALQLKQDDRLASKDFLSLMALAFRQLPLIGRLFKLGSHEQ